MKQATRSIYRAPLLAAAAMILALSLWGLWSWQGYSDRSLEWRRQRAQETFQTLNAIIATMSNGVLTDWQQIERVLASITRDSRTAFVVVEASHDAGPDRRGPENVGPRRSAARWTRLHAHRWARCSRSTAVPGTRPRITAFGLGLCDAQQPGHVPGLPQPQRYLREPLAYCIAKRPSSPWLWSASWPSRARGSRQRRRFRGRGISPRG
jgi:hypothetical protein